MLLLVGDIGGTKTILRLVSVEENNQSFETVSESTYVSKDFPDLVPMVQKFLTTVDHKKPTKACFAIAGPVVDNNSNLTNLNWTLNSHRLEQELEIKKVSLINDFAANSYGVLGLKKSDLYTLQTGEYSASSPIAIIGAGTGLGQGFLIPQGKNYQSFPSEGGHTEFAPRNLLETNLLRYLQSKLDQEHISVERVVSGQGIINIYQYLRDSNFAPESSEISHKIRSWEQKKDKNIDPAAIISQAALHKSDPLCQKTMEMFVEAYGAETGNLALKLLPYGGIYIAGGIAAKILSLMKEERFLSVFQDKGRMRPLLNKMPIHIVLNPQVGLIGSILHALQLEE
ncbi:MAG: glucokinase [Xenococcaceae cyanobacterium MO_188.B29]|nr:glucokinase [Xenococcaceae cyanobacterium MO_188.B29]